MKYLNRSGAVRVAKLGALSLVIACLLAGAALIVSDHLNRALAATGAPAMAGAGCGGDCGSHPGSCAARMASRPAPGSGCPAHARPAQAQAGATCGHPAAAAASEPTQGPQSCQGKDCQDCAPSCPGHKAAKTANPAPSKPAEVSA